MCEETTDKSNARNIMILFLSNLHGKRDGNETKLLWSSTENEYSICQSAQTVWCMETNEAPLKEVLTTIGKPLDAIFYFSTKQVGMYPPQNGEALKKRIEICFPPHHTSSEWYDSEAHFFWTVRAKEVAGDLLTEKTRIVPVPFEDEGKGNFVGEAISAVRLMESAIKQYLKDESIPLDHCYLYADITGGKRTANMAMSAVIQLLQYEGVHLRRVVYSDYDQNRKGENGASPIHPVGNVQPIHDMHRLVAGVDAFEKYGSSAALKDFFEDEIKPGQEYEPLAKLLSAMDKFSEAVLLCQPDTIGKTLQGLIEALEAFPKECPEGETRPAKVELFARMLPSLWEIYTPMYHAPAEGGPREVDQLEVIKWCVKNMLLQPAVTFCVEWLPAYYADCGIAYTDDQAVQIYCEDGSFPQYRPSWKNFLMEYCTRWPIPPKDKQPKKPNPQNKDQYKTAPERIAEIAREYNLPGREYTYNDRRQQKLRSQEQTNYPDWGKSCWTAAAISRVMLECGMMETQCDVDKAVDFIRDYTYIRAYIRNKWDHAAQQDDSEGTLVPFDMNVIKTHLQKFLGRLEEQKNRRQILQGLWEKETRETQWEERKAARKQKWRNKGTRRQ